MAKRLYFIADESGHVKIGTSVDPHKRLKQFQTSLPRKLTLLYDAECVDGDESWVHAIFADYHVLGEWFVARGMLRDFLAWAKETRHPGPWHDANEAWSEDEHLAAEFGDAFLYRCHELGC